ncbi:DUF1624 domain-containing protein [Candidatus Micrarchaeota archaeon]|nr:DUF1624 domain-containing protein [Candidatus Micrarchaeota archaeon]
MRIRSIDVFRGMSILLMVFFTLILRLSDSLPELIIHNVRESIHIGDFVLPMFLFASGISLVFFIKKRKDLESRILDIVGRFGKFVMISLFISSFSAGELFGMDELMLSAVLFLPVVLLIRFSDKILAGIGIGIFALYFVLQSAMLLPDFTLHYLGGYSAAIFYLPVMLGGAIVGKNLDKLKEIFVISILISIVLLAIIPPYKMSVSPSFMALSISVSLLIFILVQKTGNDALEYLGKKPIRYWILMFAVLIVPLDFYALSIGEDRVSLWWFDGVLASLMAMVLLFVVSKGIDLLKSKLEHGKAHIRNI